MEPPPLERIYLFAGTQHTPGVLPPPDADPNTGDRGLEPFNVVDYAPLLRAALVNLDRWASEGIAPPASAFPRLADGTAVPAESTAGRFRRRTRPGPYHAAGPARLRARVRARHRGPSPPKIGAPYPTFVSAVDADGNETAGIRPVEIVVPLGTFTGWNPRHPSQGAPGDLMSMMGSTLAFARTRAERLETEDPRASIAERYASRGAYLAQVRQAAVGLVGARHLLAEDVEAVVARAGQQWDLFHEGEIGRRRAAAPEARAAGASDAPGRG